MAKTPKHTTGMIGFSIDARRSMKKKYKKQLWKLDGGRHLPGLPSRSVYFPFLDGVTPQKLLILSVTIYLVILISSVSFLTLCAPRSR